MEDVVILFRPTGPRELQRVAESGYRRWPPRLPEQPIFYPVTNEAYARQIAERWNVKESGSGFVTRFAVRKEFLDPYERQVVGAREHEEYWYTKALRTARSGAFPRGPGPASTAAGC